MAQTQEYFRRLNDSSLAWSIRDIQEAMGCNYTGESYGKYSDQLAAALAEKQRRDAVKATGCCPHCGK
jgi:hypothetical protein